MPGFFAPWQTKISRRAISFRKTELAWVTSDVDKLLSAYHSGDFPANRAPDTGVRVTPRVRLAPR
ncbi:MAG: hypothetical protein KDC95_05140 [Planctomycetes bacterium]|nr:hypothetical protein [Planctomycetota bacterium]